MYILRMRAGIGRCVLVAALALAAAMPAALAGTDADVINAILDANTGNTLSTTGVPGWTSVGGGNWMLIVGTNSSNGVQWDVAPGGRLTFVNMADGDLSGYVTFSGLDLLDTLNVGSNQLTSLDVSNNQALTYLYVANNQLTSLDVSNNQALERLAVTYNQLTSLDVSNNTALTGLYVAFNHLTSLDVSNNTALTTLHVYNNRLTNLDVSNNTALTNLNVSDNRLTNLDVSKNTLLTELRVDNNRLPLSQLYALKQHQPAITYLSLGTQDNAHFISLRTTVGQTLDLSGEERLGPTSSPTTFNLVDAVNKTSSGHPAVTGDGLITFSIAGDYKVEMTNNAVTNSASAGGGQAIVYTGAIHVQNAATHADSLGVGLGGRNARALTNALLGQVTNGGLMLQTEAFEAILDAVENAATPGEKLFLINSLHGETLAGGANAVRAVVPRAFFSFLSDLALRPLPETPTVAVWNAAASVSPAFCTSGGVFGVGSFAKLDADDGYFGYDLYNAGGVAFLDRRISSEVLVGGGFGVHHTKVDWDDYDAKTNANTLSGALYASLRRDRLTLSVHAGLGYSDIHASRKVTDGLGNWLSASSSYDMWWFGGGVRGAYRIDAGSGFALVPSLGFDYVHSRTDSFRERNAGAAGLAVSSTNHDSFEGIFDIEASKDFGCARPWLKAGVAVEFADRQTDMRTRFAGEPGIPAFNAKSADIDRASFLLGAGVDVRLNRRVSLNFDYSGRFQSDYHEQRFRLGVTAEF